MFTKIMMAWKSECSYTVLIYRNNLEYSEITNLNNLGVFNPDQANTHAETSQMICNVKQLDWFLYQCDTNLLAKKIYYGHQTSRRGPGESED